MSKDFDFKQYIKNNIIRLEVSHRGGGIEIDISDYLKLPGARMTAYQNYLGGGLLGAVSSDCNFTTKSQKLLDEVEKMASELKRYYHDLSNGEVSAYDEYSSDDFENIQNRPVSAY